jgi:mRNA-degrading endonuclease RelE of RelBE toxin-antitoxin system
MEFRISDTFTQSLARLTGEEQKAIKTAAFDLQLNPAKPGLSLHKLDSVKDKRFWSVRVSSDLRIILHRSENSLMLCYVDHHDDAYKWAERRKLEIHPTTGAAQLVEIRETVQEIFVPVYIQEEQIVEKVNRKLFEGISEEVLLSLGVPPEWLKDVQSIDEDGLFALADHLPSEAAEALLELAVGGKIPVIPEPAVKYDNPFDHPDAQRRFRVMTNLEELERALEFPWDKWAVFLHPSQQQLVEKDFAGPARVGGSAGTGKTIVALHRAVYLAKQNEDSRILLTTFSTILANALKVKLRRLVSNEPHLAERIEIQAINEVGLRLYKSNIGNPKVASEDQILQLLKEASVKTEGHKFTMSFLLSEWKEVVDSWQIKNWEVYRDVKRLGRKTRLPEKQREVLWTIFSSVLEALKEKSLLTLSMIFNQLADFIHTSKRSPFDFAVVDEAQDVGIYHLRLLAAIGGSRSNGLFFAGDLGQRIFQSPFSWKALGVDVRGRSKTLQVNYRTSHQIRRQADLLLGPEVTDADGNVEERGNTISVFNGPAPEVRTFKTESEEGEYVLKWVQSLLKEGVSPHEIGIFVRSENEIERAKDAINSLPVPFLVLDDKVETISTKIAISTMHLAKGLEFKAVVVMACDDEIIPSQERIESITDNSDLEDVYNTERHLLYVACTRARERLLVTSVEPSSEFLEDLVSSK